MKGQSVNELQWLRAEQLGPGGGAKVKGLQLLARLIALPWLHPNHLPPRLLVHPQASMP